MSDIQANLSKLTDQINRTHDLSTRYIAMVESVKVNVTEIKSGMKLLTDYFSQNINNPNSKMETTIKNLQAAIQNLENLQSK